MRAVVLVDAGAGLQGLKAAATTGIRKLTVVAAVVGTLTLKLMAAAADGAWQWAGAGILKLNAVVAGEAGTHDLRAAAADTQTLGSAAADNQVKAVVVAGLVVGPLDMDYQQNTGNCTVLRVASCEFDRHGVGVIAVVDGEVVGKRLRHCVGQADDVLGLEWKGLGAGPGRMIE